MEFLILKGGYTGSYESTVVKMSHGRELQVAAHLNRYPALHVKYKVGVYVQQRFKSVCSSAQSDQSLSCLSEETLNILAFPREHIEDSDQTVRTRRLI